uniref:Uncharacterized protein n=1 Tax=Quercus lobata TaxID=97700 RepID=A0A7N2MXL9_QUELO
MSPPSLGNGSKENEGCLQFHFDSYNVQNGRGSKMGNHAHAALSNSPFKGLVMTSERPPYGMVSILISFPMRCRGSYPSTFDF